MCYNGANKQNGSKISITRNSKNTNTFALRQDLISWFIAITRQTLISKQGNQAFSFYQHINYPSKRLLN